MELRKTASKLNMFFETLNAVSINNGDGNCKTRLGRKYKASFRENAMLG